MDINDLKKLSGLNERWTDFLPGGTGRKARRDYEAQKADESEALLHGDGENWIAATNWYGDYNVIGKFANKAEALQVMDKKVRDMHDDTNGELSGIVIPPEGGKYFDYNGEIYDLNHDKVGDWRSWPEPEGYEDEDYDDGQMDMFDDIAALRKLSGLAEDEEVSKMAKDAMDDDDEVAAMASPEDESNWEDMEEGHTPGLIPTPDYLCHQCTMMHTSYTSECDECGSWDIERIEVDDPRHSSKNDYFDEYRAHNESVNEAYSYLRTPIKKR